MPQSAEQTTRAQGALAGLLALIAGYVDAYALLNYDVFASFMSGNTTEAGLRAGLGRLTDAAYHALPIPIFVMGVFLGTFLLHGMLRHPLRWVCALVAALLIASLVGATRALLPGWFSVVCLSLAMGAMNTTITSIGAQAVSLGFVTGDLNNIGRHLALALRRAPVSDSQGSWDTHLRRATLLAGVWMAFLCGAIFAGAAMPRFGEAVLIPPILALLLVAASYRDAGRPA
jgi:uncharacterized membrane protein YoaK (UPF0700 family)